MICQVEWSMSGFLDIVMLGEHSRRGGLLDVKEYFKVGYLK